MCLGNSCRRFHLGLGSAGLAEGDIVTDRAGEQERFLQDHPDLPPQLQQRKLTDVLSVQLNGA
ncbi:hypothetical protein D3C80_1648990 [compost metagenome]